MVQDEPAMVPYTYSFCRRCAGRVELGKVRYGTRITCPACGFDFVISPPKRIGDAAEEGRAGHDECKDSTYEETAMRRWPPLQIFVAGVVQFPFYSDTLWPLFQLAATSTALIAVVRLGVWCAVADGEHVDKATRVLLWNGLLLSLTLGGLVGLAWIYMASAYGAAIFHETAGGADRVRHWPNLLALEELGECLRIPPSLFLALVPGAIASPLWNRLGVSTPWATLVVATLLLPPILLFMLEANSSAVWQSLVVGWRAWAIFYFTMCPTAAITALAAVGIMRHTGSSVGNSAAGVLVAAGWMIFFRQFGRLPMFFTGVPMRATR